MCSYFRLKTGCPRTPEPGLAAVHGWAVLLTPGAGGLMVPSIPLPVALRPEQRFGPGPRIRKRGRGQRNLVGHGPAADNYQTILPLLVPDSRRKWWRCGR